jgi:PEP-CTERM motif
MNALSKRLLTTIGLTISGALCCGGVSAATLELSCTNTGVTKTELDGNIACPSFNLAGQVLSSIEIDLTGTVDSSSLLSLTNNAATTQTASAKTLSDFFVQTVAGKGPGNAPNSGFTWANPVFTVQADTGSVTLSSGQSKSFNVSGTQTGTLGIDTTQFAPYIGPNPFDIHATTITGLSVTGGGGQIVAAQATNVTLTGKVIYTYLPVPEPATVSLIAVGIVALLAFRRAPSRS